MPIELAKVLTREPIIMIRFAIRIHCRRPILVEIKSPIKAVKIDGMKKEAA
jgi:hypothetical protein